MKMAIGIFLLAAGFQLVAQVETVRVSSFGYDEADSTRFLQAAIDSGAKKVVVDAKHWVTLPLRGRSDQEIFFEDGAVVEAKRGAYFGVNDCVFTFPCCSNVVIGGKGEIRMWHDDYLKPPYKKSEWRHAIDLAGSVDARVWGLRIVGGGGDGVYVGGINPRRAKGYGLAHGARNCTRVVLEDLVCDGCVRQGCSVTGVEGFRAERCVFRNTRGLPPQAGIDFEPNGNGNRMSGIVMRDCVFENNRGFGIELALSHNEPGAAKPFDMLFERCRTIGNASSVAVHNTRPDHTEIAGRLVFRDCSFEHPRGGSLAINATPKCPFECEITGCRVVRKGADGKDAVTPVDENWIRENLPFLAKKGTLPTAKPKVDYAALRIVDAAPGKPVKLAPFKFRNRLHFTFHADKAGPVNIRWKQRKVGKYSKLKTGEAKVVSLQDGTTTTIPLPSDEPALLGFSAPAPGFYSVAADVRRIQLSLLEADCPVGVDLTDDWQNVIGSKGDMYFWVPERSPAFGFFVAGDGGEAIGIDLVSPDGTVVWSRGAVFSWSGYASGGNPAAGLWKASFRRADRGSFEDWSFDLSGVEGYVFLSSEKYWKR